LEQEKKQKKYEAETKRQELINKNAQKEGENFRLIYSDIKDGMKEMVDYYIYEEYGDETEEEKIEKIEEEISEIGEGI